MNTQDRISETIQGRKCSHNISAWPYGGPAVEGGGPDFVAVPTGVMRRYTNEWPYKDHPPAICDHTFP